MRRIVRNVWKPGRIKARLFPDGKRERRYRTWVAVICTIALMGWCIRSLENRFTPLLLTYAEAEAVNVALQVAGNAVAEAVQKEGLEYRDILVFYTREDGSITACKTDTGIVNRLQTMIVKQIGDYYEKKQASVSIPLGNISQSSFLYGRGPKLKFPIVPIGRIDLEYGNDYEACGINQTRHSLYFTLHMDIQISGSRTERKVHCSGTFPIAEAVIVGYVPESYTDFTWKQSE